MVGRGAVAFFIFQSFESARICPVNWWLHGPFAAFRFFGGSKWFRQACGVFRDATPGPGQMQAQQVLFPYLLPCPGRSPRMIGAFSAVIDKQGPPPEKEDGWIQLVYTSWPQNALS
jgi:hypothetical protein